MWLAFGAEAWEPALRSSAPLLARVLAHARSHRGTAKGSPKALPVTSGGYLGGTVDNYPWKEGLLISLCLIPSLCLKNRSLLLEWILATVLFLLLEYTCKTNKQTNKPLSFHKTSYSSIKKIKSWIHILWGLQGLVFSSFLIPKGSFHSPRFPPHMGWEIIRWHGCVLHQQCKSIKHCNPPRKLPLCRSAWPHLMRYGNSPLTV